MILWFCALHMKWLLVVHTHTHTHPFNGPLSGTTQVIQYQKGKTNLDFTEARDIEWQWHQLGHICKSAPRSRLITMPEPTLSFLQAGCPSCRPTNSVKALKANSSNALIIASCAWMLFLAWQEIAEDPSCSAVQTAPNIISSCPPDIEDQVYNWVMPTASCVICLIFVMLYCYNIVHLWKHTYTVSQKNNTPNSCP